MERRPVHGVPAELQRGQGMAEQRGQALPLWMALLLIDATVIWFLSSLLLQSPAMAATAGDGGKVRGHVIVLRGRVEIVGVPLKVCSVGVEGTRSYRAVGDTSKIGSVEDTLYASSDEEADYRTQWVARHDPKTCTYRAEALRRIVLYHLKDQTGHAFHSGDIPPVWTHFSRKRLPPAVAESLINALRPSIPSPTGLHDTIAGRRCDVYTATPDPSVRTTLCLLSKDDKEAGSVLALKPLRLELQSAAVKQRIEAESISLNTWIDRRIFRPPEGADIRKEASLSLQEED